MNIVVTVGNQEYVKKKNLNNTNINTLFCNKVNAHVFGGNVVVLHQVSSIFCQERSLHTKY